MLVVWGKYDPSFEVEGAHAYRDNVPSAEVHVLEGGHFVLDEAVDQVAALMVQFLGARRAR
jgi:surfactin synthase thioesterase subunit